jgi:hypothetical protein
MNQDPCHETTPQSILFDAKPCIESILMGVKPYLERAFQSFLTGANPCLETTIQPVLVDARPSIEMTIQPVLIGAKPCLEKVFPDAATRPCLRTFREWQKKRLIPYVALGRRIFFDPVEVRRALDRQFSVRVR